MTNLGELTILCKSGSWWMVVLVVYSCHWWPHSYSINNM